MVNLSDTAGLRETDDEIESIGIEKTKDEIENADIVLRVYTPENIPLYHIDESRLSPPNSINIINKCDTISKCDNEFGLYVSAKTGHGMDTLLETLKSKIHNLFDASENTLTINSRTKQLLETAHQELRSALDSGENYDIFAEHTRRASDAIGKILGTITTNEVLDKTFGQLCLGK